ncbi:urease accessory protein UreD [Chamaesiphon minutus]|uniref:Urease accessory protein UreD n=1 Tax=Chamaesiphon minutus (strain ATCC 27169 / PCC 6605) TaxID=1173020 RepID=K9UHA4_CHAP6|nr:urease accessory protein UreD [Chamaesiphon minutus]AFY93594.1 urease accessory protein UreH [Chamaesiphon minutus PCC 6605]
MLAELISSPLTTLNPPVSPQQLTLEMGLDRLGRSFVYRQYATYPFRLSRPLRLDPTDAHRAYLYIMNSSPGLLAGDRFQIGVKLGDRTSLYLTDQSASKVHLMPLGQMARICYDLEIGTGSCLEFVPEPLILYRDANLEQTIQVALAPNASLFLSEIMIPGRLARGEYFHFSQYFSRLKVSTTDGDLVFTDAMRLIGKAERLTNNPIFTSQPILASIIVVMPAGDLQSLEQDLEGFVQNYPELTAACSSLPNCNGLLVRAMSSNVPILKAYINYALTRMRHLNGQPPLPEIPK